MSKPVRKIPPNTRSNTGYVPLLCQERAVWFESALERDFLYRLDFNENLLSVLEQPVQLPYLTAHGRDSTYTPDFLYVADNPGKGRTSTLVEIKYEDDLQKDAVEIWPKLDAGRAYAESQGWNYELVTDRDIRTPFLKNVKFLSAFRRQPIAPYIQDNIDDIVHGKGVVPVSYILDNTPKDSETLLTTVNQIWAMVAAGTLGCDLQKPLNNNASVWSIYG